MSLDSRKRKCAQELGSCFSLTFEALKLGWSYSGLDRLSILVGTRAGGGGSSSRLM